MRSTLRHCIPAFLIVLASWQPAIHAAGAVTELNDARSVSIHWLMTDCGAGEDGKLEGLLTRFAPELETLFIQALDQGPDSAAIEQTTQTAVREYERRRAMLNAGVAMNIPPADLARLRAESQAQAVARATQDFIRGYRSSAVAGLAIVGGPTARARLERIANDPADPLNSTAVAAVARMNSRGAN